MTAHGLAALRNHLEGLRRERDHEVRERLEAARGSGEDEYLAIKEEEAVLAARIANLEDLLARASVADAGAGGHTVVGIGATVSVEFLASGATARLRIVGAHEPLRSQTASTASPIGQALLGKEPGEIVQFELPSGKAQSLRVLGITGAGGA
jgi:transcription elongation factor GreA